jgi:hypothetical protein
VASSSIEMTDFQALRAQAIGVFAEVRELIIRLQTAQERSANVHKGALRDGATRCSSCAACHCDESQSSRYSSHLVTFEGNPHGATCLS